MEPPLEWPALLIRETFVDHFVGSLGYGGLGSKPLIPVDDKEMSLFHVGMSPFKGVFLGKEQAKVRHICHTLMCIRFDGDLDSLGDYERDPSHHAMTEILGTISFAANLKEKAIENLWTLLTMKYKLPAQRLYATYFGGDEESGLSPDTETFNTWIKYLPKENILACKDNFWKMDDTGPCGPYSGIFVDHLSNAHTEICQLIFVEFDRSADRHLEALPSKHVATRIKFERLTSILQNKTCDYDTDVFTPVIAAVHMHAGLGLMPYSDAGGFDAAHRLMADHVRTIAVANQDHSQLGDGGREYLLRCMDRQAALYGLEMKDYAEFVNFSICKTAASLPELICSDDRMVDIVNSEVEIHEKTLAEFKGAPSPPIVKYKTRLAEFLGRPTQIIYKDKDILCSLIALCNALLLGAKINLESNITEVSERHLLYLVQKYLLYGNAKMEFKQNLERSRSQRRALAVLPQLPGSIYIDVKFDSINGFVNRAETALFEYLGVPLYHGWVINPPDEYLVSRTYRKHCSDIAKHKSRQEAGKLGKLDQEEAELLEKANEKQLEKVALHLRSSQLTRHGLSCLHNDLKENEPSVLLWNNHFITMTKVGRALYVLVNDLSFLTSQTCAVWEILNEAYDGPFFDCKFEPIDSKLNSTLPLTKDDKKRRKKHNYKQRRGQNDDSRHLKSALIPGEEEEQQLDLMQEKLDIANIAKIEEAEKVMEASQHAVSQPNTFDNICHTIPQTDDSEKIGKQVNMESANSSDCAGSQPNISQNALSQSNPQCVISLPNTSSNVYQMRAIDFFGCSTHIIHQDKNGPCALIAISNVLLLKGEIKFPPNVSEVSEDCLLYHVQDLLEKSEKMKISDIKQEVLDVLPMLPQDLEVNIKFNRNDGFVETPQYMLFDFLDISLYHAWLPGDMALSHAISGHSYYSLTEAITTPNFPKVDMVLQFLRGPQMTAYGLRRLYDELKEKVPCVLFWNHHFSTIIKMEGSLYSLVSDLGYLTTNVVWQSLNEVSGGGSYMDCSFMPLSSEPCLPIEEQEGKLDMMTTVNKLPEIQLDAVRFGQMHVPIFGPMQEQFQEEPLTLVYNNRQLTSCAGFLSLQEFVKLPGNHFSEKRTLFATGTSLTVVDTRKVGRVIAAMLLKYIIEAHAAQCTWNGKFDLSSIYVMDGSQVVIWRPFCEEFSEDAMLNDYLTFIAEVLELFRIENELPAFFGHLARTLKEFVPNTMTSSRLRSLWEFAQAHSALKYSLSRADLFSGIYRVRRFASNAVRGRLRKILLSECPIDDWRSIILSHGHPVLEKIIHGNPDFKTSENCGEDDNEETQDENGKETQDMPLTYDDALILARHTNEHGTDKPKTDPLKNGEKHEAEVHDESEEKIKNLSEFDLLYSHFMGDILPDIIRLLLSSPLMTVELYEWLQELFELYNRPELL